MNDSAIHLPNASAPTETSPAKRGRKSETLSQRLERLQHQLQQTKQAVAEGHRRQRETVGAAILAEAEADSAFKLQLMEILRRRVTTANGKADIASLLAK